ncbi:MAG: tetratricopeptide repeat protein [Planctomycetota bacterium]
MLRRPNNLLTNHMPGPRVSAATLAAALLGLLAATPDATAQQQKITADQLIGNAVSQPDSPRYSDITEAIRRFSNRDAAGAQLLLEQAKRKFPKLPPVSVMLAKMHLLSGNNAAVRPALELSVNEDADDPEPYLLLAEQALAGNRTIEADALFDKATTLIDAYDDNAKRKRSFVIRAYQGRAIVAPRRRKWEAAEADIRVWLDEDPENATAYNQLGNVLFMLDKKSDGLKAFAEAKRLNKDLPNPYVTAGAVLQRQGESADAIEYFRRAYREDRADATNVTQYANALVISGNLNEAAEVLEGGLRDAPDSLALWLLSGVTARMRGDNATAVEHLQRALAIQPTNRDSILQLTYIFADGKDDATLLRARQYAILNTRLNEKNSDAQVALAWTLERSGQSKEASAALNAALQGGRLASDSQLLVAKMYLARDRKDTAKRVLSNALEQSQGIFVGRAEAETLLAAMN